MNHKKAIIGLILGILLSVTSLGSQACAVSPLEEENKNQNLATLNWYPKSHDFLNKLENMTDQTTFDIWKGGGCCSVSYSLSWDEDWVDVFPTSGTSNGEHDTITVTIDTKDMAPGQYTCGITITSNVGNGLFTVYVTIVEHEEPTLAFSPISYDFGPTEPDIIDQTLLEIWNNGLGVLTYNLSENISWVQLSPPGGTSQGEHDQIQVQISTADLEIGPHSCDITIQSNGGNGTFTITVLIQILPDLDITIKGGIGIRIKITNIDTDAGTNLAWTVNITGGTLFTPREKNGTIPSLDPGQSITIKIPVFGWGPIQIQVEAVQTLVNEPKRIVLFFVF